MSTQTQRSVLATRDSRAGRPARGGPTPPREADRIRALRDSGVLGLAFDESFDQIAFLAAQLCGAPMAMLSFVDEHERRVKAAFGFEPVDLPRHQTFCAYTILQTEILEVPDASKDPRFSHFDQVAGAPHIRFFAAAPVLSADGYAIGGLCALDLEPRTLTEDQAEGLVILAGQVTARLGSAAREGSAPEGADQGARTSLVSDLLEGEGYDPDRVLRTSDVAGIFGVTERAVTQWAMAGKLPFFRTVGGHHRYLARDVLELYRASTRQG